MIQHSIVCSADNYKQFGKKIETRIRRVLSYHQIPLKQSIEY